MPAHLLFNFSGANRNSRYHEDYLERKLTVTKNTKENLIKTAPMSTLLNRQRTNSLAMAKKRKANPSTLYAARP